MNENGPGDRFRAQTRVEHAGETDAHRRIFAELTRIRSRFERAARDGREAFSAADSDSYDIGMLAVMHLADFVQRDLPEEVVASLPMTARDGLRATRNIAAHNYTGLDNSRLWQTVTLHAPALLDEIATALNAR